MAVFGPWPLVVGMVTPSVSSGGARRSPVGRTRLCGTPAETGWRSSRLRAATDTQSARPLSGSRLPLAECRAVRPLVAFYPPQLTNEYLIYKVYHSSTECTRVNTQTTASRCSRKLRCRLLDKTVRDCQPT